MDQRSESEPVVPLDPTDAKLHYHRLFLSEIPVSENPTVSRILVAKVSCKADESPSPRR